MTPVVLVLALSVQIADSFFCQTGTHPGVGQVSLRENQGVVVVVVERRRGAPQARYGGRVGRGSGRRWAREAAGRTCRRAPWRPVRARVGVLVGGRGGRLVRRRIRRVVAIIAVWSHAEVVAWRTLVRELRVGIVGRS